MKARDLNTIHDLIATNYKKEDIGGGQYMHSFTPKTSSTKYQFIANFADEIEEGTAYNIGFTIDDNGNRIIDKSCLSKNTEINPNTNYLFAQVESQNQHTTNKHKNDTRVEHKATDGYYWGKKYAYREFGLIVAKAAFHKYMKEINHPIVECFTNEPGKPRSFDPSFAYKEEGIKEAMDDLIGSATKAGRVYFSSPLYSAKFSIRGVGAFSDKK